MGPQYDVTIITIRPGTQPSALAKSKDTLAGAPGLLMLVLGNWRAQSDLAFAHRGRSRRALTSRMEALKSGNPYGIGEWIVAMTMDIFVAFDFLPPVKAGKFGPCYEVRTYVFKTDGLAPTAELWRNAVPGRSPRITPARRDDLGHRDGHALHAYLALYSLDERTRLRAKAVDDKVWPPPGGPSHLAGQQSDIYLPAPFSRLR